MSLLITGPASPGLQTLGAPQEWGPLLSDWLHLPVICVYARVCFFFFNTDEFEKYIWSTTGNDSPLNVFCHPLVSRSLLSSGRRVLLVLSCYRLLCFWPGCRSFAERSSFPSPHATALSRCPAHQGPANATDGLMVCINAASVIRL